jgi:hypothetical protein
MNKKNDQEDSASRREVILHQYALIADRRLGWDSMLNDAPNTALTALAFLLLIALGPNNSDTARIVTSAVALLVSIAAISSLGRFRLSELTDAELLLELEKELKINSNENYLDQFAVFGPEWAKRRRVITEREIRRARFLSLNKLTAVLGSRRSFNFWISVFLTTTLISIGVIISTLLGLKLFN